MVWIEINVPEQKATAYRDFVVDDKGTSVTFSKGEIFSVEALRITTKIVTISEDSGSKTYRLESFDQLGHTTYLNGKKENGVLIPFSWELEINGNCTLSVESVKVISNIESELPDDWYCG